MMMQLKLPVKNFLAVGKLRFPYFVRHKLLSTFWTGNKGRLSQIHITLCSGASSVPDGGVYATPCDFFRHDRRAVDPCPPDSGAIASHCRRVSSV
jgi:hypothetical protein